MKGIANPQYEVIPYPQSGIRSFNEFYPYYLGEHRQPATRRLHLTGTSIYVLVLIRAFLASLHMLSPTTVAFWRFRYGEGWRAISKLLGFGMLQGYFFAWLGHFFIEKNRPATFKHPLWSLTGDFKMWQEVVTGQRKL